MTLRKLMMLAGIGGFIYYHRKRGGEMSLEGFKQTGRELVDNLRSRASDIRSQAESRLHDVASKVEGRGEQQGYGGSSSNVEDVGYGTTGYDYGRNR